MSPQEIAALRFHDYGRHDADPHVKKEQYTKLVSTTFHRAFQREQLSLEDTTSDRIRAAWRIIREMARSKRLVQADEPLISALFTATPTSLDMWTMPTENPRSNQSFEYLSKVDANANSTYLRICADALRLDKSYWPWALFGHVEIPEIIHDYNDPTEYDRTDADTPMPEDAYAPAEEQAAQAMNIPRPVHPDDPHAAPTASPDYPKPTDPYVRRAGLPLMPPPAPLKWHTLDGLVKDDYDPLHHDPGLRLYVQAVNTTAQYLGVHNGSVKDPDAGRNGLSGLTNCNLIRIAMPTRMQLIAWEYILITKTLDLLTKSGSVHAYKYLVHHYGFTQHEVTGLIYMARRFARDLIAAERAEDRAIMVLRCEEMMMRCRLGLDFKAEQNAMKQMSMILGLTRTEEDETLSDFVSVVKKATNERKQLAHADRTALPLAHKKDGPAFDLTIDE